MANLQPNLPKESRKQKEKQPMGLIEDPKLLKRTFMKRTSTLKKKGSELTALCDVPVCIIFSGPDKKNLNLWPEDPSKAKDIIMKYKEVSKDGRRMPKKLNLTGCLETKEKKLEQEVWDKRLNNLSRDSVKGLMRKLELKIQTLDEKIKSSVKGKAIQAYDGEEIGQKSTKVSDFNGLYVANNYNQPWGSPLGTDTNFSYMGLLMGADDQTDFTVSGVIPQSNLAYGIPQNTAPMVENYSNHCVFNNNNIVAQRNMGFGMAGNFGMMQENNNFLSSHHVEAPQQYEGLPISVRPRHPLQSQTNYYSEGSFRN